MTILKKDLIAFLVEGDYSGSSAMPATVTVTVTQATSTTVGPTITVTPTVDLTWEKVLANGRANASRVGMAKGIYGASHAEIEQVKETLFPGVVEPGLSIQFNQYKYSAVFGKPIYIWPEGYYVALWSGDYGIGYYTFIGYDPTNYPTQDINIAPAAQRYATTMIERLKEEAKNYAQVSDVYFANQRAQVQLLKDRYATYRASYGPEDYRTKEVEAEATAAEEQLQADWDAVFSTSDQYWNVPGNPTFGSGYNPDEQDSLDYPYYIQPISTSEMTVTTQTTMPGAAAAAGVEIPKTAVFVNKVLNRGWNTWARSIDEVELGTYLKFTAAQGIDSACLGLGPKGLEGAGVARFKHSIVIDRQGVKVQESGEVVYTLSTAQNYVSVLRIYRHVDGTIAYVISTGGDTVVYTSDSAYSVVAPLYIYGYLYSSGDKITSAAFATGEVNYGSV